MSSAQSSPFSLLESLLPFGVSVSLLAYSSYRFGSSAGEGAHQLSLLIGAGVAVLLAFRRGITWRLLYRGVLGNIKPIVSTLVFLLLIGAVSVTWLLGGVIPAAIYYGIYYLPPAFFLVTVTLFSGLMGLACGSSWLTIGTMGVAFLGIGNVLGFSSPVVAGAIISGAYFGDKLTPLSETTVLAASMSQTPLLRHVRYMLWTSIPAFLLTLGCFAFWSYAYVDNGMRSSGILRGEAVMNLLAKELFDIRLVWLFVPIAVITLTMCGFSPVVILGMGSVLGGSLALCYQGDFLSKVAGKELKGFWEKGSCLVNKTLFGVELSHEDKMIAHLFTSGGVWGMWPTISIILASVILSGVMEGAGLLRALMGSVGESIQSRGGLFLMTTSTAVFFNITVADQYLAIILTAKLLAPLFKQQGLANENVSRTVEDAATVTSPLIPWNTCGATQAKVLNVPTMHYLPYCFFNLISPVVSVVFGLGNIKIARKRDIKNVHKKKRMCNIV